MVSLTATKSLSELRRAEVLDGNQIANWVEKQSGEKAIDQVAVSELIRDHSVRVDLESVQRIQNHAQNLLSELIKNRQFEIAKSWLHLASEMGAQIQVRGAPGASDGQTELDG